MVIILLRLFYSSLHSQVSYDTYSILNANADTLADDIIAIFSNKVQYNNKLMNI